MRHRIAEILAILRAPSRSSRIRLRFERYYRRHCERQLRAELDQWAADCARLQELPTQEVSRWP